MAAGNGKGRLTLREIALPAIEAAPSLLGALLVRQTPVGKRVARIIETEAYDEDDPASHSFGRQTPRNKIMFGPPGRLYVYLSYGMHHCMNIVCGPDGRGEAVLIRALEAIEGTELMIASRNWQGKPAAQMLNGPGKICQALEVDLSLNGADAIRGDAIYLMRGSLHDSETVITTPRIGITKAADWPRRYVLTTRSG
ncbi:DNA-3-methyladenine glycosylase [bacterium]|nr:DNA-3-methyladenine glycosylase [bacterium]